MKRLTFAICLTAAVVSAQTNSPDKPTWWSKYQALVQIGADGKGTTGPSFTVGTNVDVSNECGPQSETSITLNPAAPLNLAAGSNEIFRHPMRGYFSFDGGNSWGGVDLPLASISALIRASRLIQKATFISGTSWCFSARATESTELRWRSRNPAMGARPILQ
jgi:hypothetical protein